MFWEIKKLPSFAFIQRTGEHFLRYHLFWQRILPTRQVLKKHPEPVTGFSRYGLLSGPPAVRHTLKGYLVDPAFCRSFSCRRLSVSALVVLLPSHRFMWY